MAEEQSLSKSDTNESASKVDLEERLGMISKENGKLRAVVSRLWHSLEQSNKTNTAGKDLISAAKEYIQTVTKSAQDELSNISEPKSGEGVTLTTSRKRGLKSVPSIGSTKNKTKSNPKDTLSNSSANPTPNASPNNSIDLFNTLVHLASLPLECSSWDENKLNEFMVSYRLERYIDVFRYADPYGQYIESIMFEPANKGSGLNLISAPLQELTNLLVIPTRSPLKSIWHYDKFLYSFLIVYPAFMTPHKLLDELMDRWYCIQYQLDGTDMMKKSSILNVLKEWLILSHSYDFVNDQTLLKKLTSFLNDIISTDREYSHHLQLLIGHIFYLVNLKDRREKSFENHLRMKATSSNKQRLIHTIFHIPPDEYAKQLTMIEWNLFSKLKRDEFLNKAWYSSDASRSAPNILAIIENGNNITRMITTHILQLATAKLRADAIEYYITVITHLYELNNFNTLMHILSSLHSSSIHVKLKECWRIISKREKTKELFDNMTKLMDTKSHYKNYHDHLKTLSPSAPFIPLLSVICSDLTAIYETVPNTPPSPKKELILVQELSSGSQITDWINWDKMDVIASRISDLLKINPLHIYYDFPIHTGIVRFIKESEKWDDDVAYQIASLREMSIETEIMIPLTIPTSKLFWHLFQLTERDWYVISSASTIIEFEPDECIVSENTPNYHVYFIIMGRVKVIANGTVIDRLGIGDWFGELSMLTQSHTLSSLVAITPVKLMKVDPHVLSSSIFCREFEIGAAFYFRIATHIANTLVRTNTVEFFERAAQTRRDIEQKQKQQLNVNPGALLRADSKDKPKEIPSLSSDNEMNQVPSSGEIVEGLNLSGSDGSDNQSPNNLSQKDSDEEDTTTNQLNNDANNDQQQNQTSSSSSRGSSPQKSPELLTKRNSSKLRNSPNSLLRKRSEITPFLRPRKNESDHGSGVESPPDEEQQQVYTSRDSSPYNAPTTRDEGRDPMTAQSSEDLPMKDDMPFPRTSPNRGRTEISPARHLSRITLKRKPSPQRRSDVSPVLIVSKQSTDEESSRSTTTTSTTSLSQSNSTPSLQSTEMNESELITSQSKLPTVYSSQTLENLLPDISKILMDHQLEDDAAYIPNDSEKSEIPLGLSSEDLSLSNIEHGDISNTAKVTKRTTRSHTLGDKPSNLKIKTVKSSSVDPKSSPYNKKKIRSTELNSSESHLSEDSPDGIATSGGVGSGSGGTTSMETLSSFEKKKKKKSGSNWRASIFSSSPPTSPQQQSMTQPLQQLDKTQSTSPNSTQANPTNTLSTSDDKHPLASSKHLRLNTKALMNVSDVSNEETFNWRQEYVIALDIKFKKLFNNLEIDDVALCEWNCVLYSTNGKSLNSNLVVYPTTQTGMYFCTSGTFSKMKDFIMYDEIQNITLDKKRGDKVSISDKQSRIFVFSNWMNTSAQEAYNTIYNLWIFKSTNNKTSGYLPPMPGPWATLSSPSITKKRSNSTNGYQAECDEIWNLIMKGGISSTYKKDHVILKEGERNQRIYVITKGECRIEKEGISHPIGKMTATTDNIFGELVCRLRRSNPTQS
eukprot:TRINITY_DN1157_c2_g1_i2.p1 TRINITY_DN1157_c2_g1~~TRINITY_DN1157_c2_g1_i2.p1  ORF type:complete len:1545 (+),score=439.55 TRINITY_DN1157_c2_g1_i2:105-4739(+)